MDRKHRRSCFSFSKRPVKVTLNDKTELIPKEDTLVSYTNNSEAFDKVAEEGMSPKMHNGETAMKPKSLLWKLATDCTRFDWRIWICKARRAQLMVWNTFSATTTESPCGHVVSVDERRLKETQNPGGGMRGNRASFTAGCSCNTSSFTCRCITLLSELLSHISQCEGVPSTASVVLTWWFKRVTIKVKSMLAFGTPVGIWWRSYDLCYSLGLMATQHAPADTCMSAFILIFQKISVCFHQLH